jgi:hypothetical protein
MEGYGPRVEIMRKQEKIKFDLTHLQNSEKRYTTKGSNIAEIRSRGSSQLPVAHTCNPSYSEGSDQEDCCSKLARANSLRDPILKTSNSKKGWWIGSRCRP